MLARISHQVAMRMMKNNLFLSISADFSKVSPGQTARSRTPPSSSSKKLPIPDDRRGTPCGCPAGSHRSPAESPLHVATPGARKDAGPSRRRGRRRSRRGSGRRSQSATRKSPLHHPPGPVVPRQWPTDGGAVRGEGDHKGRPYEAFDSGNAVGAADGPSPPGFSRDHAGGPAVGDFLVTSIPGDRRGTPCGCPPGSHRSPAEPSRHPPAQ